jgi:hypothetical protein
MAGLPRLGRRWKGGSSAMESSARKDDDEGAVRARREGFGGVGCSTGGGVSFYRVEVRRGRAERLQWPARDFPSRVKEHQLVSCFVIEVCALKQSTRPVSRSVSKACAILPIHLLLSCSSLILPLDSASRPIVESILSSLCPRLIPAIFVHSTCVVGALIQSNCWCP